MNTTLTGSPIQAGVAPTPAEQWTPPQLSGKSPRLIAPTEVAADELRVALDAAAEKVRASHVAAYRKLIHAGRDAVRAGAESDAVAFAAMLAAVGIDTAMVMADLAEIERHAKQTEIAARWPDAKIAEMRQAATAADAAITPVRERLERLVAAARDANAQLHRARYSRNDAEQAAAEIASKNPRVFGK
jgi:chromosome segregation ATPase